MPRATKRNTTTKPRSRSLDIEQLVQDKMETIRREKQRIEESLRHIERELADLSSTLEKGRPGGRGATAVKTPTAKSSGSVAASDKARTGQLKSLADRSNWSPMLRKLIDTNHPEATKAERIRRATERPIVTLDADVPLEVVKYYAEDTDFEYDV